jgi:hypothetical protein
LCIIMDLTGSMSVWIEQAKKKTTEIFHETSKLKGAGEIRIAFVGYRDYGDKSQFEVMDFIPDHEKASLGAWIQKRQACNKLEKKGDCVDYPEDVAGAFQKTLELKWESPIRLVVHITDAPCHGHKYHTYTDRYPKGDPLGRDPEEQMHEFAKRRIDYYFLKLSYTTDQMTGIFKQVYDQYRLKFAVFPIQKGADEFLPLVLQSISASLKRQ